MHGAYRLSKENLLESLKDWDERLRNQTLVVACGGTALTLLGYKESTKDVDFLIPKPKDYEAILKVIKTLGYKSTTECGYVHPAGTWLFELYKGQTIFQTELLDPIHEDGNHRVIKTYQKLTLGCLNPEDLIISKMFRGTGVDVNDCIVLLQAEKIDLQHLAQRYKETADYYINPPLCKKHLGYLIDEMSRQKIDATALMEMNSTWTA